MTPPAKARDYALAFLIGSILMLPIFFGRDWIPGHDGYYHLRMARLLPEFGAARQFPWLQWTFFREHFVNHHLGFHAALFPFAWMSEKLTGDLVRGGQVFSMLAMGLTAVVLLALLRQRQVPHPLAWVLLLGAAPWHFWLRQGYVRAPVLGLPLLLLAVLFFLKNRPWPLAILAVVYLNTYFGAVLFVLVPLSLAAGYVLCGNLSRPLVLLALAAALGLLAGMVLNPYFPTNVEFLRVQLFGTGLGAPADAGNEWRSLDSWFLLNMCAPILGLLLVALFLRLRSGRPLGPESVGLMILHLLLFALSIKARRFLEYWPAFALLHAADLANGCLPRRLPAWALTAILALGCSGPLLARSHSSPSYDFMPLREALDFLRRETPPGSTVMTDDWDLFPFCFYQDQHNHYLVGLDPVFTIAPYPEIWDRYRDLTRGDDAPHLAAIRDELKADYVLVTADQDRFYRQLNAATGLFEQVYSCCVTSRPSVTVFRVRPR